MPDDRRPQPPFRRDHPGGPRGGFTPRPAFVPPRPPAESPHSVRLRDGDREVDVSGSAGFVRQVLEDLPTLLARLRGEPPRTRAAIALPPPPDESRAVRDRTPATADTRPAEAAPERAGGNGHGALDDEVIAVVRTAGRPIGIAEIRRRLRDEVSGQQVRRILERHPDAVASTGGRPAAYRPR